jgi:hypothetical protein
VLPLLALSLWHVLVLSGSFSGANGMPDRVVPFDFGTSYSRFLVFISDSLHAGAWPIWMPYGQAGVPFYLNPQSQLWSPVTWLVSLFSDYSLLAAQRQLLVTILVGSMGVYAWGCCLWEDRWAALLAAIAYNFTSARLCNAEHLDIVNAFSIFPWVFWAIHRTAHGAREARPVLAIALALLVVSGYPGVVLLSPLWFGGWALWLLAKECPDPFVRRRFLRDLGIGVGVGVVLAAGYWLPIAVYRDTFSRGATFTTDAALAAGLSIQDLTHLVFGSTTGLQPDGSVVDLSMRGLYFGILSLALALLACLGRGEAHRVAFLGIGATLALLMSLGGGFFLRVALHNYLPFLNIARNPAADSRAVAALAGCLLAGRGLLMVRDDVEARRRLGRIVAGLALLLVAGLLWAKDTLFPSANPGAFALAFNATILAELAVLGLTLVCLIRTVRPGVLMICLLVLVALDSGVHTSSDAVMFAQTPAQAGVADFERLHDRAFDPKNSEVPRVDGANLEDIRAAASFLNKKFYLPEYGPFRLKRLDNILAGGFRPFLLNGKRVVGFPVAGSAAAVVPLAGATFEREARPVQYSIKRYLPDRVEYEVDLKEPTTLVFNEIYFPGWRARVDGGAAHPMLEVAGGLRAMVVSAGNHRIETRFSPAIFWVGLALTSGGWLFVLLWLAFLWRSRRARAAA